MAYYSKNYAGILGSLLPLEHGYNQSESDTARQTTANVPSQDGAKGWPWYVLHMCWNL